MSADDEDRVLREEEDARTQAHDDALAAEDRQRERGDVEPAGVAVVRITRAQVAALYAMRKAGDRFDLVGPIPAVEGSIHVWAETADGIGQGVLTLGADGAAGRP